MIIGDCIKLEIFDIERVNIHAISPPKIIKIVGSILFEDDKVDETVVNDVFIHAKALPVIIAHNDKKITALEIFLGSFIIKKGKFI